jgi:hypothetical protein
MKTAAALCLFVGATEASFNEPVSASSFPETIDAGSIYFSDVTYRSAKIHWAAPGLGDWAWPIQGYEIQITTNMTWNKVQSPVVPGSQAADSYSPDALWGLCPVGEHGDTMVQCAESPASIAGTVTSLYWEAGQATEHEIVGLQTNTMYYFRIRAQPRWFRRVLGAKLRPAHARQAQHYGRASDQERHAQPVDYFFQHPGHHGLERLH